jgi:acetyl esterase/lipase
MKASLDEAPELYEQASPIAQISPDDPPFFVIHGGLDTMVPVAEARGFCQKFRDSVKAPIVYAEIPGAQHAFEIFPSLRTAFVIQGVERFVSYLYSEHLRCLRTSGEAAAPVTATG